MYRLSGVEKTVFEEPWHLPLAQRLRQLAAGEMRIAYFYEKADNSTFRYRVYNMAHVLNQDSARHSAAYFFLADLHRLDDIADGADMLVICRTRYDGCVRSLTDAFHRRGKRVLFDVDDLVFDTAYVHLLVHTLDLDTANPQVWQDWFAYCARLGATLRLCDAAITTNDYLAQRIAQWADIPVSVVPNFMNPEQLEMSGRVHAARLQEGAGADGMIHLGYFSGSPSHNRDFALVVPALEELLDSDARIGLVVVGYIDAGPRLTRFGSRVVRFPFQDYVNLQRLVGAVDINLMPLQHNVFTNCKSELKYFEAAAVGVPSVASPTRSHLRVIRHGVNGYLAASYQWLDVMRQALSALGDSAVARHAREHALTHFTWQQQGDILRKALGLA